MKLLACPICHDVAGLLGEEWRICLCGASGGQYNADMMTATIGGVGRVFGVGNPFFNELYPYLDVEGKRKMRQRFYGQPDTDAWWGEYPGDIQIFRIENPSGPRLKIKIEHLGIPEHSKRRWEMGENRVTVTDKRPFTIDGKSDVRSVVVPANFKPALRQTIKRKKPKDDNKVPRVREGNTVQDNDKTSTEVPLPDVQEQSPSAPQIRPRRQT